MIAPPSGFVTPIPGYGSGLGTPRDGAGTPEVGYKNPQHADANDLAMRIHDVV